MKGNTRRTPRRLHAILMILVVILGMTVAVTPASASAPVLLGGSQWLGGSGVNVCSASTDPDCGGQTHVGGWSGNWWQCVELAQRLYLMRGWHSGIFAGVSYAYQIYDQAPALGMSRQANGSITSLMPGDMIIHGSDTPYSGGAGHVSIVDSVVGSTVNVIEQNTANNDPTGQYTLSGGTLSRGAGTIRGVVHDPDNAGSPGNSAPSNRIGVLGGGVLNVKVGPIGAGWTTVGGGSSFKLSPNRIALYTGQLLIKEGTLGATWTTVTGAVDEFEVTDNRIGIRVGTQIFIKDGSVGAPWIHVADGVSFEMSSNRIAVYTGSALIVKQGSIYAGWTTVTGSVDDFQVTDNRLGIRVGSTVSVKDGSIGAVWTTIGSGSSFKMSPNRIALYDGQLSIKEGPIGATWVTVTGAVDEFEVTDNRVGILVGGQLSVKDGPIGATWTLVGGGSSFDLT